jgi:hypothetical protein
MQNIDERFNMSEEEFIDLNFAMDYSILPPDDNSIRLRKVYREYWGRKRTKYQKNDSTH